MLLMSHSRSRKNIRRYQKVVEVVWARVAGVPEEVVAVRGEVPEGEAGVAKLVDNNEHTRNAPPTRRDTDDKYKCSLSLRRTQPNLKRMYSLLRSPFPSFFLSFSPQDGFVSKLRKFVVSFRPRLRSVGKSEKVGGSVVVGVSSCWPV
jgi:hypothetical protein